MGRGRSSARRGSAAPRGWRTPRSAAPSGGCPSTAPGPSCRCRAESARPAPRGRRRRLRREGARGTRTSPRSVKRRPQERLAGDVGNVAVSLDRIAPRIDAEQLGAVRRSAGAGRAAGGSSSSCPSRSARDIHTPRQAATVRSSAVERERAPVALAQPFRADHRGHLGGSSRVSRGCPSETSPRAAAENYVDPPIRMTTRPAPHRSASRGL